MSAPWFDAPAPLLPDILALHGRWLGNKPAIICDDETLSWRALCDALCRFANGLHAAGLKPGDRVAVLMDNTPEMMVALFGIIQAGCVTVPLNLMVADEALAVMVRDADAIGVVASASQAPRLETLRREALSEEWPLGTGPWLCHGKTPEGWADFRTWLAGQSAEVPSVTLDDGDECNIIYSSGTTGKPKGIVHTHRRRLDWFRDLALALRYDRATVNLCAIGLFSNISWAGMGCTLLCGGTVVIMRQFDADQWLTAVARHGVTHSAMVPVQFQRILGSPAFGDADLASIKSLMCCGSPLEAELKARILETLNPQLVELYGLTEGLITTLEPEDAADRLASVGKPLVGIDLLILDDQDTPCPPGTPGEIVGRGPHLLSLIHISEPTRPRLVSRMPSSA